MAATARLSAGINQYIGLSLASPEGSGMENPFQTVTNPKSEVDILCDAMSRLFKKGVRPKPFKASDFYDAKRGPRTIYRDLASATTRAGGKMHLMICPENWSTTQVNLTIYSRTIYLRTTTNLASMKAQSSTLHLTTLCLVLTATSLCLTIDLKISWGNLLSIW
jgi:hypothetical protein